MILLSFFHLILFEFVMFVAGKRRKPSVAFPGGAGRGEQSLKRQKQNVEQQQQQQQQQVAAATPETTINRWYLFGLENYRERQYRNALEYYDRAIALARNEHIRDAKLCEARAQVLYKMHAFQRAMDDAKEVVRIDDTRSSGYELMASILASTGKRRDALAVVNRGLKLADQHSAGYKHLQTKHTSLLMQLEPRTAAKCNLSNSNATEDPLSRLPGDIVIMILRLLDTGALIICRGVSKQWMRFMDNVPVVWSNPSFVSFNAMQQQLSLIEEGLPGYTKLHRKALSVYTNNNRAATVPEIVLRRVFRISCESLKSIVVPAGTGMSPKTLSALLLYERPRLICISLTGDASLSVQTFRRILCTLAPPKTSNITEIRVPYCAQIGNEGIAAVAKHCPMLRILDISGCALVRVKQLFRVWTPGLVDIHSSTRLEELYMNDHPGIAELLVYSSKHRHFSKLRVLHISIRNQEVYSMFSSLGPLMTYFQNIEPIQTPFPRLRELNIEGLWDATVANHRYESSHLMTLLWQCQIFTDGLQKLLALNASAVGRTHLQGSLQQCFASLKHLHLTRANNLDTQMLLDLTMPVQLREKPPLPLVSLDLSGCAGVGVQGLLSLLSCCNSLVYVNLGQTAADNSVLYKLTEMVEDVLPASPKLEVLALEATDVTGAAVRDFAAACINRYRQLRGERRAWRLRVLDIDNCVNVGSDAVGVVQDLLSSMGTKIMAVS